MASQLAWAYKRLHDAINYRLRTAAGGRWASYCRPAWITFLLTELCNARCVHCYIWKNKGPEEAPTPEQWKAVLRDLRAWLGPAHVCFSGGEALLRPFTVDLVAYSSSIGLFPELLTHGYWDDQSKIEQLALAKPWRVTVSLDGMGETHTRIRGREKFFEKTSRTIETLRRMRTKEGLDYSIRLKTVIMAQNLDDLSEIARFASQDGMDVLYQPIVQTYNTEEDAAWYKQSETWPTDTEKAARAVQGLLARKREGASIANSEADLESMVAYFRQPDAWRVATEAHTADQARFCAALTTLQFQANGDVTVCSSVPPVGNIKQMPIRQIWKQRPQFWVEGCCIPKRCAPAELEVMQEVNRGGLVQVTGPR